MVASRTHHCIVSAAHHRPDRCWNLQKVHWNTKPFFLNNFLSSRVIYFIVCAVLAFLWSVAVEIVAAVESSCVWSVESVLLLIVDQQRSDGVGLWYLCVIQASLVLLSGIIGALVYSWLFICGAGCRRCVDRCVVKGYNKIRFCCVWMYTSPKVFGSFCWISNNLSKCTEKTSEEYFGRKEHSWQDPLKTLCNP